MTTPLQQVIPAVRALSSREKLELLEIISHDLQQSYTLTEASTAFWTPQTTETFVQTHTAPIVTDIRTLAVDFWPEDESADDINHFINTQRRDDRTRAQ